MSSLAHGFISTPLRVIAVLGGLVVLLTVAAAWLIAEAGPSARGSPLALPAARVEGIVRRMEVAFADAEGVWNRAALAQRRAYRPAEVRFFGGSTGTACASDTVIGPFYCRESGLAGFDVRYLDALGDRLKRHRDLGLSLYAVRIAAEHLQREIGDSAALEFVAARRGHRAQITTALALQGDCLTGAWASAAAPRLGPVPDGFWDQLVWSSRNVSSDLAAAGGTKPEFDVFAQGDRSERSLAFAAGYASGRIADCRFATVDR